MPLVQFLKSHLLTAPLFHQWEFDELWHIISPYPAQKEKQQESCSNSSSIKPVILSTYPQAYIFTPLATGWPWTPGQPFAAQSGLSPRWEVLYSISEHLQWRQWRWCSLSDGTLSVVQGTVGVPFPFPTEFPLAEGAPESSLLAWKQGWRVGGEAYVWLVNVQTWGSMRKQHPHAAIDPSLEPRCRQTGSFWAIYPICHFS